MFKFIERLFKKEEQPTYTTPDFVLTVTGERDKEGDWGAAYSTGLKGGHLMQVADKTFMGKWAIRWRHGKPVLESKSLLWGYAPDAASAELFQRVEDKVNNGGHPSGIQLQMWGKMHPTGKPKPGTFKGNAVLHQDMRFEGHVRWEIVEIGDPRWIVDRQLKDLNWDKWAPHVETRAMLDDPDDLLATLLAERDVQTQRLAEMERNHIKDAGKAAIESTLNEEIVFEEMD